MDEEQGDFEVVETRKIAPDPGVLKAIGLNHTFESAVADLVDNSVDAGATRVHIRFVVVRDLVRQLLVLDDGRGMDGAAIDIAMQLGRAKVESTRTLGHFGMGLKAASFSQASELTLLSRIDGGRAEGRRMSREGAGTGFECDVLREEQVAHALDRALAWFPTSTGTVVRWDSIRTFPASKDPKVTEQFVEAKRGALQHHLGLMFHRILEKGRIVISIDSHDAERNESGLPFAVEPIDPFAYGRTGDPGYPKTLIASTDTSSIPLVCHIWPGGSDSQHFKLSGRTPDNCQGFYVYRNDRLLSVGGWGGVVNEQRTLKLARAAVNIEDHLALFTMSAEKSTVRMVADLVHAVESARAADGTLFKDYIRTAESVFQESNKRVRARAKILPPGKGIAPRVKRTLSRELEFIEGENPVEIRWKRLANDDFVEVDRVRRTLWMNDRYREALLRGGRAGSNDAPLVKALLFLLYENIFRGAAVGAKDKDNLALWQAILSAAAVAESESFDE